MHDERIEQCSLQQNNSGSRAPTKSSCIAASDRSLPPWQYRTAARCSRGGTSAFGCLHGVVNCLQTPQIQPLDGRLQLLQPLQHNTAQEVSGYGTCRSCDWLTLIPPDMQLLALLL